MNKNRDNNIPYVGIEVQLHSCIPNKKDSVNNLISELKNWLEEKLAPEYESDIMVDSIESAEIGEICI
jgi:hypothetical protein